MASNSQPFSALSTTDLAGVYGALTPPRPFVRDVFFKGLKTFNTTYVSFDKMDMERRVAQYVDPDLPAVPTKVRGFSNYVLQPAYIKIQNALTADYLMNRMYGEALNGEYSLVERQAIITRDQFQIHENQACRAEELQAIEIMLTGKLNISGQYYSGTNIDYGRPSTNTVQLTGAACWGQSGVDPLADLNEWSTQIQQVSTYVPRVVIMSPDAFDAFQLSPNVARIMQSFIQFNPDDKVNLAGYAVGGIGNEARQVGMINNFEIWTYQQNYWDANGNYKQMMPPGTVIMGDPVGCGGMKLYGAIQNMGSLQAVQRFPEMFYEKNPSRLMMTTESSPLMALGWAEATFCATVF